MRSWGRLLAVLVTGLVAGAAALLRPGRLAGPVALPPARHEATDVGFRPMLLAGLAMLAGLATLLATVLWLFPLSVREEPVGALPALPSPQLQSDPAADMARFHALQLRQLDSAYWLDRSTGAVHLPIAQAMQDVARRGIADWPAP